MKSLIVREYGEESFLREAVDGAGGVPCDFLGPDVLSELLDVHVPFFEGFRPFVHGETDGVDAASSRQEKRRIVVKAEQVRKTDL